MKNWKMLVAAVVLFSATAITNANAQGGEPPFVKGSNTIGIALGVGGYYGYYDTYGGYGGYSVLPSVSVTFDHGVWNDVGPGTIGIGGVVGFSSRYGDAYGDRYSDNNFTIGARGTYHLTLLAKKNNKFDPYGGILLGLRFHNVNDRYRDYTKSEVLPAPGIFVGAKYNFTESFGAFVEVGPCVSLARVGIGFNF